LRKGTRTNASSKAIRGIGISIPRTGSLNGDFEKWFDELEGLIFSSSNEELKKILGEKEIIRTEIKDEFFAELRAQKSLLIRSTINFNQTPYFCEINSNEKNPLKKYLEKIIKNIVNTENNFQSIIEKEIPNNRDELKVQIESLRRLDPRNRSVEFGSIHLNAFSRKRIELDNKELSLIRALALLEDDRGDL
jgi:hypothetical protein